MASRRRWWAWLGCGLLGCGGLACGGSTPEVSVFTSDVVQRETCRSAGAGEREFCVREPVTTRVQVTLVEDDDGRVVLHGLPRDSGTQGALLGTRDQSGGFLFFFERRQENTETGCVLQEERTLALAPAAGADAARESTSPCTALLGRDTAITIASAACEPLVVPPVESRRIVRRRWEPAVGCDEADPAAAD